MVSVRSQKTKKNGQVRLTTRYHHISCLAHMKMLVIGGGAIDGHTWTNITLYSAVTRSLAHLTRRRRRLIIFCHHQNQVGKVSLCLARALSGCLSAAPLLTIEHSSYANDFVQKFYYLPENGSANVWLGRGEIEYYIQTSSFTLWQPQRPPHVNVPCLSARTVILWRGKIIMTCEVVVVLQSIGNTSQFSINHRLSNNKN